MTTHSNLPDKLSAGWPPAGWRDVTVLVAISGGADSVALARALLEVHDRGRGRLVLAHYNHRLRGAESDADEAFVRGLAGALGLELIVGMAATSAAASEAALRDERYAFLTQAAGSRGARFVALAHTADDQVETILFNILRGSGLAGAAGIPKVRRLSEAASLVRPLLDVARAEVLAYLAALGQEYREDATNRQLHFTRNRIRHELLPLLERDYNPHVRQALLRLSRLAGEADALVVTQATELLANTQRPISGGFELRTEPLKQVEAIAARAALIQAWRGQAWPLQDMSFEKWDQLLAFATAPIDRNAVDGLPPVTPLRQMYPGGVLAEREGNVLRLTCRQV